MNYTLERELPVSVVWDITKKCNLQCKHCYNYEFYKEDGLCENELDLKSVLNSIEKLKRMGVSHFHFLGGEPLLRSDISEIIQIIKENDIRISIGTNGIKLNNEMILNLVNLKVDLIMVSLDGASEGVNDCIRGKGVFKTVTNNISMARFITKDTNTKLGVNFTASKTNSHEIPELFNYAIKHNLDQIYIVPVQKYGNYNSNIDIVEKDDVSLVSYLDIALEKYADQIRDKIIVRTGLRYWVIDVLNKKYNNVIQMDYHSSKCNGGKYYYVLQANGDIGPCFAYIDKVTKQHNSVIDNILETKQTDLSDLDIIKKFHLSKREISLNNLEPCNRCRYLRTHCEPCPIQFENHSFVEQCIWAERIEQSYFTIFSKYVLILNSDFELVNDSILNNSDGSLIKIGNMLAMIINKMQNDSVSIEYVVNNCFTNALTHEQVGRIYNEFDKLLRNNYMIMQKE